MVITKKTKISAIIAEDESVIDVIASINKNFKKLKNPILRKMLAPRIKVADAAKVGGVSINEFLSKLKDAGFKVELEENSEQNKNNQSINTTDKNKNMNSDNIVTLDVRPILAGGTDPFKAIMSSLKEIDDKQTLLVINSFEPIPLLNKLKGMGYTYCVERPEDGSVHSFISKSGEHVEEPKAASGVELSFVEALEKYTGLMKDIDVRHLEMPLPMVTILEEVEQLEKGKALYVNHKRLPQYLIPELETRGFAFAADEIDADNTKLIIYKK